MLRPPTLYALWPKSQEEWIPAFAGMTVTAVVSIRCPLSGSDRLRDRRRFRCVGLNVRVNPCLPV